MNTIDETSAFSHAPEIRERLDIQLSPSALRSGLIPFNAAVNRAILNRALSLIGKAAYVLNTNGPTTYDCSSFVAFALTGKNQRVFGSVHFTTHTIMTNSQLFDQVSNPKPGDIVNYHQDSSHAHCGVYYREGLMINAANESDDVTISWIDTSSHQSFPYLYYRYKGGLE